MNIMDKLTLIAQNEEQVYEAGKKSQYNEFWDALQQNGNRKNYDGGFGGWSESIFKPKYNIQPTSAIYMFRGFQGEIDMVEYLNECGVILDFSNCRNFSNFMLWSKISRMGVIDTSSATSISFYYAYLLNTVDLLILKDDGTQSVGFQDCSKLKNITIEGVIGKTLNMQWCPLSKESIISVINALSTTTSKLTVTFKKTAINDAFGIDIDDETTYPEGSEFYNLRNSKSNWTFSYV